MKKSKHYTCICLITDFFIKCSFAQQSKVTPLHFLFSPNSRTFQLFPVSSQFIIGYSLLDIGYSLSSSPLFPSFDVRCWTFDVGRSSLPFIIGYSLLDIGYSLSSLGTPSLQEKLGTYFSHCVLRHSLL